MLQEEREKLGACESMIDEALEHWPTHKFNVDLKMLDNSTNFLLKISPLINTKTNLH